MNSFIRSVLLYDYFMSTALISLSSGRTWT